MIDAKKIEEAAIKCADGKNPCLYKAGAMDMETACRESFKEGVCWGLKTFLEGLWHNAKEEPKTEQPCLVEVIYHPIFGMTDETDYTVSSYRANYGWAEYNFKQSDYTITRWLYMDDLLPKQKGGER